MLKRLISVFVCTILVLLPLSSCSSDGTGKQLITPIDSAPEYLDPQIVSEIGARNIIANCFEGLVGLDENGSIIPAAAENYDVSSDGLTYTFYLRKDAKWRVTSDAGKTLGENYENTFDFRVTADDFVYGLRRALQPETKSPYAYALFCIENAEKVYSGVLSSDRLAVRATDTYTLSIQLKTADPDFLFTLLSPACMPCNEEFFEKTGGRYGLSTQYLIYNGPFYISTVTDSAVIVRKNEDYHSAASVKPASVYFTINSEQETRAKKVKEGTYEASLLTASQADELSRKKGITVMPFLSGELSLIFNCADETLSHTDIRRAISLSFDKQPLYDLTGLPAAAGIVPGDLQYGTEKYRKKAAAFDLSEDEKAAEAYLRSGLDEMQADDIELVILCATEYENAVRAVMQNWQSLFGVSFNISVEAVDSAELTARINKGNYQLALCNLRYVESSAFGAVYRYTSLSRDNIVGLNAKQYDNIVKKIKSCQTEEQAIDAIEQAEAYLISCAVVIPVCETDVYIGLAKGVEGIVFTPAGDTMYFKNAVRK